MRDPQPQPHPHLARLFRWLRGPWLLVPLIAAGTLLLHSRYNHLPYYYEKDAGTKVTQVLAGQRNFFHPMLMLNATDLAMRLTGSPRTTQAAALAGHWCMAAFTAVAVGAFSFLAFRFCGHAGAICVGVLLATQSLLFDLSHIFKEDPALLMGLSLTFVAMQLFWEKPTRLRALWLGGACALALSAKYVGIAAPLMALVVFIVIRRERRIQLPWRTFLAAFLLTTAVVNFQIILQFTNFLAGFREEMDTLTRVDRRSRLPHWNQVRGTFEEFLPTPLLVCLIAGLIDLVVARRRQPVLWCMAIYPTLFTVVLLYSPRLFTRHFAPIFALACFFAALGICAASVYVPRRIGLRFRWLPLLLALLALAGVYRKAHHRELVGHYRAFAHPTREIMIAYINEHLPDSAVIAAEQKAYLRNPDGSVRKDAPVRQTVFTHVALSSFGSLQKLRELGVTHVVVTNRNSGLLFLKRKGVQPVRAADPDQPLVKPPRRMRDQDGFYGKFGAFAELEHSVSSGQVAYVAPALKLYRLPWGKPGHPDRTAESGTDSTLDR